MTMATLALFVGLSALCCVGYAQDIPVFTVCTSDDMYNAMEKTCAHPPIGSSLKPGVKTLEEFGRLCCTQPCSMRYFVHLCEYPEDERRRLAYPPPPPPTMRRGRPYGLYRDFYDLY